MRHRRHRHCFAPLSHLLLAVLLLAQAALAPALCLARGAQAGAAARVVELCTAEGLRVVHLPDPDGAPDHAAHEACLVCHALPQAAALPTPPLPQPAWIAAGPAWGIPALAAPPPPIRGPPSGARAPPHLLS